MRATDDHESQDLEPPEPMSLAARVGSAAALLFVVLVLVGILLRIGSPAVRSDQETPRSHLPGPCWGCHTVSEDAELIEVDE